MIPTRYQLLQWVNANSVVGEWASAYDRLGDKGQAKADERLRYLRDQPPAMWLEPGAKRLGSATDKDCKDVYEIRFKANNIQQRPLGFFGPGPSQFTVVLWATHKGNQWVPKEKCRIAKERYQSIVDGKSTIAKIEID